jgi:hypothetical protein
MSLQRIILFPALASLLLATPLSAQAALESVLAGARQEKVPWVLLHTIGGSGPYTNPGDEVLSRLYLERHLIRRGLPAQAAKDVWQAKGWPATNTWVLLSDQGVEVATGAGPAKGEQILGLLRQQGLVPAWEARQAFLRQHPENGEVWIEEVMKAVGLVGMRMASLEAQGKVAAGAVQTYFGPDSSVSLTEPDPETRGRLADQIFGEVVEALKGLQGVDGWWKDHADYGRICQSYGAAASPAFRERSALLAADLDLLMGRLGPEYGLERLASFRALAGRPLRELPAWVRLPGEEGPNFLLMTSCVSIRTAEQDWEGTLAVLDQLALPTPQGPWTAWTWQSHCFRQGILAGLRVWPLLELGRAVEARAALEEWRRWNGTIMGKPIDFAGILGPRVTAEKSFQDLLRGEPTPTLPMPPPPPALRLVLVGKPPWREAWERLRSSDALLPWGPAELLWVTLAPKDEAALRLRLGWGPEPRWALLRGEVALASGLQCPAPAQVAMLAGREGPPLLQQWHRIIENHPEHLGARRGRLAVLKRRMPEPRLEPLLAEDARVAFEMPFDLGPVPVDFGPDAPWKPDPSLWQWSAQQVLPRVEALLRSWPSRAGLWKAWLSWAKFHPSRPSVVAFADTLVIMRSRQAWLGSLPLAVHAAVTQELRKDRNHPELIRWLGDAWEGLDRRPASKVPPGIWPSLAKEREQLREALVAPLAEAYRALGRQDDAKALEAAYQEMMKR